MGGGVWTSLAIPLLWYWGGWPVWLISVGAVAFWLAVLIIARVMRGRATS
jgi:hypothetical protein